MKPSYLAASVAAVIVALCAGLYLGGHPDRLPEGARSLFVDDNSNLTGDATEIIKDNYFRKVDQSEIDDGSLDGIVERLKKQNHDRFSHYFTPEDLGSFNQSISGRFTGVGLSVSEVKRGLRIGEVFDKSPAKEAGLLPGQVVVSVNGKSIAGKSSDLAVAMIKGPEGTKVTIGVLSPDSGTTRQVRLTRKAIDLPIVEAQIRRVNGKKVGYIEFSSFTEAVHRPLRRAVERMRAMGAEGIVLDMRANGGGLLQEAILSASIFVPKGKTVVSTKSRTQGDNVYKAVGDDIGGFPIVVLVDRNTASAAEILTAALADDTDATVVGTRTFGKGVFQQVIDLPNGGALDLTIGEFYTADGTNLAGKGFKPDIRAKDNPKTAQDEGLRKALDVLGSQLPSSANG